MKGHFVWHDYMAENLTSAIDFYGRVAGWKTQGFEGTSSGEYNMWVSGQGPMGGVGQLSAEMKSQGARPGWMGHVQVEDVAAAAEQAAALGGTVLVPPTPIPQAGQYAVIADPEGAMLSIFQPDAAEEPHAPAPGEMTWAELHVRDPKAALEFYKELFGWEIQQELDMGAAGTYTIFGRDETSLGGMMKDDEAETSGWMHYVEVEDIEAAMDRATAKGGQVLYGPAPVPGGRMAQLLDPQGAPFGLHDSRGD